MAKFFVSSTSTDLTDYRAAVIQALRQLDQEVIHMETFTATDANAVERCLRDVDAADVYLGIFAWRYGFVPPENNPDGLSITEMEYRRAIDQGKRVLIFLLADDAAWPRPLMDKGEAADKIDELREYFKQTYVVGFFNTPDDLARSVSPAAVHVRDEIEAVNAAALQPAAAALASAGQIAPPPRPTINIAVTPFIGREGELAIWTDLLARPDSRLVTVVGPGGMGKSRIAIEIATRLQDRFADGACFVALETVTNGDEMVNKIAEVLRLHLAPQPTVREQLWDFHRDREILLVLDNLESVPLSECGDVIMGLLNSGKGVKCLATSQIRTGLPPERVVELDSMSGDDGRTYFIDRARASVESFTLSPQNAKYVDQICETLEGVPLAIELAASLITYMGPKEILAKVRDVLRVLVADSGTRPSRHLALRAAIEYSFQKLSPVAQALLPQLSVFMGGFTAEAVDAVCGADASLAPLGELRNHSLLRRMSMVRTDTVRLGMLESIRQFGAEKRTDDGASARHAAYFAASFTERAEKLRTSEESEALLEMEADFGNARAAMAWSQVNDPDVCARLALAYQQALYYRGMWDDALGVIETGLAAALSLGDAGLDIAGQLEFKMASILHDYGRTSDAFSHARIALERAQSSGHKVTEAAAVNLIGLLHLDSGELDDAESSFRKALELWPMRSYGERGKSLNNLARVAVAQGRNADARALMADSIRERRLAGDQRGEAITLGNLGALEFMDGNVDAAQQLYVDSLAIRRTLQEPYGIATMLCNLGEVAMARGDDMRAVALCLHAERIFREIGSPALAQAVEILDQLRARSDAAKFEQTRQAAESQAWEDLV